MAESVNTNKRLDEPAVVDHWVPAGRDSSEITDRPIDHVLQAFVSVGI